MFGVTDYWRDDGVTAGPISDCDVPRADRVPCILYEVIAKNVSAAAAMTRCKAGEFANCTADPSDKKLPCFMCKTKRYTGYDFSAAAVSFISKHASANVVAEKRGDATVPQRS